MTGFYMKFNTGLEWANMVIINSTKHHNNAQAMPQRYHECIFDVIILEFSRLIQFLYRQL